MTLAELGRQARNEITFYFEHVDWDAMALLFGLPARPSGYAIWNQRRWLDALGCRSVVGCPPEWACTGYDCRLLRR